MNSEELSTMLSEAPMFAKRADLDRRYFVMPPQIDEEILRVLEAGFSEDEDIYPAVREFVAAYRQCGRLDIPELKEIRDEALSDGRPSARSYEFAANYERMLDLYEEMRRRCGWLFVRVFWVPDTTIPIYAEHRSTR